MQLKIGTFNICHCGDYESKKESEPVWVSATNLPLTAKRIKELDFGVIALNEVYNTGNEDAHFNQTEKIANIAGYKYFAFAKGAREGKIIIGNAVLSKYPIIAVKRIEVPTIPETEREEQGWYEDRVLLVVDIDVDGKAIRVVSSHFGCTLKEREKIVAAACELIDGEGVDVLLGDFNAFPDSDELKSLHEKMTNVALQMSNTEYTFASYEPKYTIDYIFVKKGIEIKSFTVHKIKTSDHFPISAEIEI